MSIESFEGCLPALSETVRVPHFDVDCSEFLDGVDNDKFAIVGIDKNLLGSSALASVANKPFELEGELAVRFSSVT